MKTLNLHAAPLSLFWYWINERHRIFLRRKIGAPKPWTDDPILRDYKFTNPFRENDRGTVWLRENFLEPHRDGPLEDLALNICWYRMFNWWGTAAYLGWIPSHHWNPIRIKELLRRRLEEGHQVFTGAHIVYSIPGIPKIDCIVDVCDQLYRHREDYVQVARHQRSLEAVYTLLRDVNCVGGFMAYEMVTDMRHTRLLEDAQDIYTWANPGPGARRGLHRLGMPYKPDREAIKSMRELQDHLTLLIKTHREIFSNAPDEVDQLHDIIPEMRDIEHSLCEFDKYCRVKFGEGEPRSKYPGAA